jgi:hypothetical protein
MEVKYECDGFHSGYAVRATDGLQSWMAAHFDPERDAVEVMAANSVRIPEDDADWKFFCSAGCMADWAADVLWPPKECAEPSGVSSPAEEIKDNEVPF